VHGEPPHGGGIVGADLMVRVGKANHDVANNTGATEINFTGPRARNGRRPRRVGSR
jgi:hypothetical protein